VPAKDAVVIDTSAMTADQAYDAVLGTVREKILSL